MAQPSGSIVPTNFGYKATRDEGDYMYFSFPLPRMPRQWQDKPLAVSRKQKISLKHRPHCAAGEWIQTRWYFNDGYLWADNDIEFTNAATSEWKPINDGTYDPSTDIQGVKFHSSWADSLPPLICHVVIRLLADEPGVGYLDGFYFQLRNDFAYDASPNVEEDYERQPRKAAVAAKRRYVEQDAMTAYQIMFKTSHSVNKQGYEAHRWTSCTPLFGGYKAPA